MNLNPIMVTNEVDSRISTRSLNHLKAYDGQTHQSMFHLPKHIETDLKSQGRLITDNAPLYTYSS